MSAVKKILSIGELSDSSVGAQLQVIIVGMVSIFAVLLSYYDIVTQLSYLDNIDQTGVTFCFCCIRHSTFFSRLTSVTLPFPGSV
jgi:hypothetical protein